MRKWLRQLRESSGLTMKNMAEKLGISESYYCAIENGDRQKRMDMMLAMGISTILGIPVSDVVEFEMELSSSNSEDTTNTVQ